MFFAKLNETVQIAPKTAKRRKDNFFGEFSLIIGSEIWYMLNVGIVLTADSVISSGLELIGLITLHLGFMRRTSDLVYRTHSQEKQFILVNIFMKLRNKVTEDINERNKPYLMLYPLNSVFKCVIQKKNVLVRKVEN